MSVTNSEERPAHSGSLAKTEKRTAKRGFSGFVLAGGRSSRMGADKALLSLGGENLLQRAVFMVSSVSERTYIVGPKQRYASFGEVVEDIYPGCGPLGGIHAALTATATELNLILSVDMPLMTTAFLQWLVDMARVDESQIVVPQAAGGLQPLCATYRRALAKVAETALLAGEYKIGRLFERVPTRILNEREILAAGFSSDIFRNINTPEEYAQCRS
jgi:molybdenum cofactor guanylyltransferase